MSFANPTPIRVGMSGSLSGSRYRVAGRVVLGADVDGVTYYWNEFNLVDDAGDSVTLVYEETENGAEWRLFTLFEPDMPMSIQEAAGKRVGDAVTLDNTRLNVTLVDESRVYFIEGEAPEGVEVGDVAHYFNAEGGRKMFVVSWTGNEVEFYQGVNISKGMVASAFNVSGEAFKNFVTPSSANSLTAPLFADSDRSRWVFPVVSAVVIGIIIFGILTFSRSLTSGSISKTPAAAAILPDSGAGVLKGSNYWIEAHALTEIAEVGRRFERHEYILSDDHDVKSLLVCGLSPGGKDWYLFSPVEPLNPLTPEQAAALKSGEVVNIDGYVASISELFQATLLQTTGNQPDVNRGTVFYGFVAQSGKTVLLVRWNNSGIRCYQGKAMVQKEVVSAFPKRVEPKS